jgi:hypothetical protein
MGVWAGIAPIWGCGCGSVGRVQYFHDLRARRGWSALLILHQCPGFSAPAHIDAGAESIVME